MIESTPLYRLPDHFREVYKITGIRAAEGGMSELVGERWDEAQQRYRPAKPLLIGPGAQKVSIEFED